MLHLGCLPQDMTLSELHYGLVFTTIRWPDVLRQLQ